jgi:hypothetical protein
MATGPDIYPTWKASLLVPWNTTSPYKYFLVKKDEQGGPRTLYLSASSTSLPTCISFVCEPLSSEYGTDKTVKARFCSFFQVKCSGWFFYAPR